MKKTRKPKKKIKSDIRESCPRPRLRELSEEEIEAANELVPDLIKATDEYDRNLAGWDGMSMGDWDMPRNWYVGDDLWKFLRKIENTLESIEDHLGERGSLTPGVKERVDRVVAKMHALREEVGSDIRIVNAAAKAVNLMSWERVED